MYGSENSFIYILTAILFFTTIITFIRNHLDILNPGFVFSLCLTGCCSLAAIYTQAWNLPMHFNTAMILIVMAGMFILGCELASFTVSLDDTIKKFQILKPLTISWLAWIILAIFISYLLYLNYEEFLAVASQISDENNFTKMSSIVNNGINHHLIKLSRWNAYRLRFVTMMAYISVLGIWGNLFLKQYQECFKWGCFVLLYLPFMILTGGRQQFLYLILFSMVSFFLVYRKYTVTGNHLKKELIIIGIALLAFLVCFLGIGLVNGKISANANFFSILVHYAGTNISAFDVFINEMVVPDAQYIGTTTLDPIYSFLHDHGFNVPEFFQYITLFTVFRPVTTNVYTAFYRYILDYGYLGCALIMFLLGYFYNFLYKNLYKYGLKNWMILLYASIIYPIFLMGREERFFNEIFTTSKLSFCLGMLILYKIFEFLSERRSKNQ